jgi:hypothetical protein
LNARGHHYIESLLRSNLIGLISRLVTFFCLKDKFEYSVRDYLYYKKRCGRDTTSVVPIDFEHQARSMIQTYETERKVCLIMTKEPLNELRVSITPIKRSRDLVMDEEPV